MTYKELNDLRYMPYHIKRLENRIKEIEAAAYPHSPTPDCLPAHSSGGSDIISRVVENAEPYKDKLEKLKTEYETRKRRAEEYIYSLDDEYIKAVLIARFVERRSWRRTAFELGGGNTPDGVRMACKRFFKEN